MVKHKSYVNVDRYMTEYRMRTPYATPTEVHRSTSSETRRSNSNNQSTPRHAAHDRSHLRTDPPEAFYHSEGRIDKNTRKKKPHQPANENNQTQSLHGQESNNNQHHGTVPTTKKSSCCTIL